MWFYTSTLIIMGDLSAHSSSCRYPLQISVRASECFYSLSVFIRRRARDPWSFSTIGNWLAHAHWPGVSCWHLGLQLDTSCCSEAGKQNWTAASVLPTSIVQTLKYNIKLSCLRYTVLVVGWSIAVAQPHLPSPHTFSCWGIPANRRAIWLFTVITRLRQFLNLPCWKPTFVRASEAFPEESTFPVRSDGRGIAAPFGFVSDG